MSALQVGLLIALAVWLTSAIWIPALLWWANRREDTRRQLQRDASTIYRRMVS